MKEVRKKNDKGVNLLESVPRPLSVVYPQEHNLVINKANLKLELIDFKKAIKNGLNIPSIITIISLWTVMLTSEFKSFLNFTSDQVSAAFFVITLVLTCYSIVPMLSFIFRLFTGISYFQKKFPLILNWHHKSEIGPEEKVESISKRCV